MTIKDIIYMQIGYPTSLPFARVTLQRALETG
jgi:hypothetical protein